jgi:hypothetical protein
MNINGTWLGMLPFELQEMIFDMVVKSKMATVLLDIPLQLSPGFRSMHVNTKHNTLTEAIRAYDNYRNNCGCFEDIQEWYIHIWDEQLVDRDSCKRIERIIEESSPYFVYIEDLTYQELLAFKSFII